MGPAPCRRHLPTPQGVLRGPSPTIVVTAELLEADIMYRISYHWLKNVPAVIQISLRILLGHAFVPFLELYI